MIKFGKPIEIARLIASVPGICPVPGCEPLNYVLGVATLDELQRSDLTNLLGFVSQSSSGLRDVSNSVLIISRSIASDGQFLDSLIANGNLLYESDNPRLAIIRVLRNIEDCAGDGDVVEMGRGCIVKDGAELGQSGFGFERDEQGVPLRFPHLGRLVLGEDVEIGANSVVSRGTIGDTIIGSHCKIDDLVYIAHNCQIGERSMIAGRATLCGGVIVGNDAWIGAGACVKQNIRIGAHAVVGMGAVVVDDVPEGVTVLGNPARKLNESK